MPPAHSARWAALVVLCGGCLGVPEADWLGGTEPDYANLEADQIPLTIYLSEAQTNIRKIVTPSREEGGARLEELPGQPSPGLPLEEQGVFHLDGRAISERTMIILAGQLHRHDGVVEEHLLVIQPRYYSQAAGAANPAGFLQIDLKAADRIEVHQRNGWPLGTVAGVFRGQLIATDAIGLHQALGPDLAKYYIAPTAYGERSPNVLGNVELQIRPNVMLTALRPGGEGVCAGATVIDGTTVGTELQLEAQVDGFPRGRPVTLEVRTRWPRATAEHEDGRYADYMIDFVNEVWGSDVEETVQTVTIEDPGVIAKVALPPLRTLLPPLGEDMYPVEVELRAYEPSGTGASAQSLVHQLLVVQPDEQVIVDHFELCPTDDLGCHDQRDRDVAQNLAARRNVVEWMAKRQGLYATITRPLSRCAGGGVVAGSFAKDCVAYQECSDTELSYRIASELNFELSVDGQAQGSRSWGGQIPGLGGADLAASLKATFHLQTDLHSSFQTSQTWASKHNMTVMYDPAHTQIQWWRVVTPRLRYVEVAQFDACGVRTSSHDVFLSDLTDSRLVLACEEVPRYDSVCHAVEPTPETVAACSERLIDPASPQSCLGENSCR